MMGFAFDKVENTGKSKKYWFTSNILLFPQLNQSLIPRVVWKRVGGTIITVTGTCIICIMYRGSLGFFFVKDRNLFHQMDTIGNIFY